MSQGQGNITFSGLSTNSGSSGGGGGGAATARNGLSIDGAGNVVLGNNLAAPGEPAQLLSFREIDLGGFGLKFDNNLHGTTNLFQVTAAGPGSAMLLYYKGLNGGEPLEIVTIQGQTGVNNAGNFWITLDESYIAPDGQRDCVLQWGYNQDGSGGKVVGTEAEAHYAIESHFNEGGSYQQEIHLETTSTTGAKNRIYSFDVNIFSGGTTGYFTVDDLDFFPSGSGAIGTPFFAIDQNGTGTLAGPGAQFTIQNTTATSGQLRIDTNNDGSVNITNGTTGSNPIIAINNVVTIDQNDTAFAGLTINLLSTTSGAQGVFAVNAGIIAGNAIPFFGAVSATGNSFINISNGGGGRAGSQFTTISGGADCISIYLENSFTNGFSAGFQQSSNQYRIANMYDLITTPLMALTPTAQMGAGGNTAPTALVHIGASPGTAGHGPLKLTPAPLLVVPEDGLFEYDSVTSHLYFTIGAVRSVIV
jgi:hypothetical protein